MSCSNCGRQNPPTVVYCLDCGQKLREPAPRAAGVAPAGAQELPGQSPPAMPMSAPGMVSAGSLACVRCGAENPPGMRFCRMCGGKLTAESVAPASPSAVQCSRCGAVLEPGAVFCGVCGLATRQIASASPMGAGTASAFVAMSAAGPAPVAVVAPVAPSDGAPVARSELRADNDVAGQVVPAARLVTILKDGSEGLSYRLTAPVTDIGRSEGNIVLPDDPYLSPRHARISLRNGRYYLRDLGSVNGIFYRLREPTVLSHGDVLLLGQQVLRLEILTDEEISFGPVMHYGVLLFATPEQPRLARLVQLTTEGIPRDIFHLYREETVVGRESGDIVFTDDPFMSRRHAVFKLDRAQRRVSVKDLGSSNGTLLRFRGEREIVDGDLFRIGQHLFRFELPRSAVGASGGHQ